MDPVDTDPNFEPQQRARSNTWPLPRPDNYGDKEDGLGDPSQDPTKVGVDAGALPKKNSSRRNAWGNMSYADLITQAIQSSPEKRLTLSQIYDWMVQNVPYFKDKGDSNSSAGWKAGRRRIRCCSSLLHNTTTNSLAFVQAVFLQPLSGRSSLIIEGRNRRSTTSLHPIAADGNRFTLGKRPIE